MAAMAGFTATVKRTWHYLANLEWTERPQPVCIFCDSRNLRRIVYDDGRLLAFENLRPGGQHHWIIIPKAHVARDIEALTAEHLGLLRAMDDVKRYLIEQHVGDGSSPSRPRPRIHAGYHRGRRRLFASSSVYYPDVVSVHHLHLHVIVRPRLASYLFKHPFWLPLMWKSDETVLRAVAQMAAKSI